MELFAADPRVAIAIPILKHAGGVEGSRALRQLRKERVRAMLMSAQHLRSVLSGIVLNLLMVQLDGYLIN